MPSWLLLPLCKNVSKMLDLCQPIPNYFVINVDDQLHVIINGRYRSMVHRVMVISTKALISIQIFTTLPMMQLSLPQCL
jgi:isopenicillin N synthase-like dioxygenase